METETSGNSAEIDNQNVNVIVRNLFDRGLEELLLKIFLFLDPKSLKNSKSTCSQWREFIDRRIWKTKSDSVKHQLLLKLNSCWKTEAPVRIINKELPGMAHNLVCDSKVIMCSFFSEGITAFHADTVEQIYSIPVPDTYSSQSIFFKMDISGEHLIAADLGIVQIFEKMTGKELYRSNTFGGTGVFRVKMLKNVGVVSAYDGTIYFFRRGAEDKEWTEEKIFSGIRDITHVDGDDSRLVIGTENGIYLWNIEEKKVIPTEEPSQIPTRIWKLTFHFPHVCVVGGRRWDGLIVLNISTGQKIRHIDTKSFFYNIHCNGKFVLLSNEVRGKTKKVIMYDMEELVNISIKDKDLWSRRMSISPYHSGIDAVSNTTKIAVSDYRKKLTVYDVWKDRDYEECPDESVTQDEE